MAEPEILNLPSHLPDEEMAPAFYPLPKSLKAMFCSAFIHSVCSFAETLILAWLYNYHPSAFLSALLGLGGWTIMLWASGTCPLSGLRYYCKRMILFTVFPPQDLDPTESAGLFFYNVGWCWLDSSMAEEVQRERAKEYSSSWFTNQSAALGGCAYGWRLCYHIIHASGSCYGQAVARSLFGPSSLVILQEGEVVFSFLWFLFMIVGQFLNPLFRYKRPKLTSACIYATLQLFTVISWKVRWESPEKVESTRVALVLFVLFGGSLTLLCEDDLHSGLYSLTRSDDEADLPPPTKESQSNGRSSKTTESKERRSRKTKGKERSSKKTEQLVNVTLELVPQGTSETRLYKVGPNNTYIPFKPKQ